LRKPTHQTAEVRSQPGAATTAEPLLSKSVLKFVEDKDYNYTSGMFVSKTPVTKTRRFIDMMSA
jgi:hypothetical protein